MPALTIVIGKDQPILKKKTKKVEKVTKEILALIDDMKATVIVAKGAGLAAPQVNRSERICLALIGKKMTPLINPEIIWKSDEMEIAEEGCLSLPDVWLQVARHEEIVLKYITAANKKQEVKLVGWDARVVQHEVDHLEGILITDHKPEMVL